jgi:hypothetical protein
MISCNSIEHIHKVAYSECDASSPLALILGTEVMVMLDMETARSYVCFLMALFCSFMQNLEQYQGTVTFFKILPNSLPTICLIFYAVYPVLLRTHC